MFNASVENQDLNRNKDDLKNFKNNFSFFKFLNFHIKQVYMYVCLYSVYKVDYRGAATPKKWIIES